MNRPGSILLTAVLTLSAAGAFAEGDAPALKAEDVAVLDPLFKAALENCKVSLTVDTKTGKTEDCQHYVKGHTKHYGGMKIPDNAAPHMEELRKQIADVWPEMKYPSIFAAQIEQESCIHLKHAKCWNTKSELKTDREMGFGLGQLTLKYKDGSGTPCKSNAECDVKGEQCRLKDGKCAVVTMNMFEEMRKLDDTLKLWDWEDRGNAAMQIRSVVLLNKRNWNLIKWDVANDVEKLAMMLSAYNGGLGHVLKDRQLCIAKGDKCDPSKWFGNIELDSVKAKKARSGYGKSFFEINREYPIHVFFMRRPKYVPLTDGPLPTPVPTVAPPAVVNLPAVVKQGTLKFPPAAALAGKKEAEVVLDITIKEDGSVGKVKKVKGDDIFVEAAKESLKKNWEFAAGTRDGVPVESSFELTLLFKK